MEEPHLITSETTALQIEELLGDARLMLYGARAEWNSVIWLDDHTFGVGKGSTWYLAADRALRSARGKAGR